MTVRRVRFEFESTALSGLIRVKRIPTSDDRGYFTRFWCAEEFSEAGWAVPIIQINHTMTRHRGTVRGMHFQNAPHSEKKMVNCVRGSVFDVALDLRRGSPTFLKWHAEVLSAANQVGLLIPEGFAHGFQALESDSELLYLHSSAYCVNAQAAVNVADPVFAISWPLPITWLSARDKSHPMVKADFKGLAQ